MKCLQLFIIATLGLMIALAGCGEAERTTDNVDYTALLPESVESPSLERSSEIRIFVGDSLYAYINGGAELYHAYDFIEVATAYYLYDSAEIVADLYRFKTSDYAYGLYSALRPDDPRAVALGVEGFTSGTSINFVKGDYLVRLIGYDESAPTVTAVEGMARVLDGLVPGTTAPPERFLLFPSENVIPATDKITAEYYLGQKSLSSVYSRNYLFDGDTLTLFLTMDGICEKFLEWSQQVTTDESGERILSTIPFDNDRVLATTDSYYGRIVAGSKEGWLLGVINYSDVHEDFLNDWLKSLL